MTRGSSHPTTDRVVLGRTRMAPSRRTFEAQRQTYLWTIAGGLVGSTVLLWIMVQLGQASSDGKTNPSKAPATAARQSAGSPPPDVPPAEPELPDKPLTPPSTAVQGPALDTPREVVEMLDLRKRDLDRREEAVRQNEERLLMLKAEIEQLLARNEAVEKRLQEARAKQQKQVADQRSQQAQAVLERERQEQERKHQYQAQLAKIYESMPAEEAAARLEKMPDRKAVEILRLVKGKTAGSILAQVNAARAAKLTEQLLAHNP